MAYDTMFHQQAAGNPEVDWSKLNPALYTFTFLAQSGLGRNGVLCMELDHSEEDCAKAKWVHSSQRLPPAGIPNEAEWKVQAVCQRGSQEWFCLSWNQGECFPYCRHWYSCIKCWLHCIIYCNAWGADWESWRKQSSEPQRWEPQGRDQAVGTLVWMQLTGSHVPAAVLMTFITSSPVLCDFFIPPSFVEVICVLFAKYWNVKISYITCLLGLWLCIII